MTTQPGDASPGPHGAAGGCPVILVPDAGPLISLGKADLLDLLLAPGFPVVLVDQVEYEVTKDTSFSDARRCHAFVERNPGRVVVFETEVGRFAAAQRRAGMAGRQRGLGEAAVAEFLVRIDEVTGDPMTKTLVIFEDSDVTGSRFLPGPSTHLLSTWSYLLGLETMGLLPAASAAWAAINAAGRKPAAAEVDRPPSGGTRWGS